MTSEIIKQQQQQQNFPNELLLGGGGPRKRDKWLLKHNHNHNHNHNEPQPTSRCRLQLPQLPTEIWVDIMSKLPIKPLYVCKCVSKTWRSYVSHILSTQKGIPLPPCGLLFEIMRPPSSLDDEEEETRAIYLAFLSLAGDNNKLTKWSIDDDASQSETATITMSDRHNNASGFYDDHGRSGLLLLGSLTLAFGSLTGVILNTREYPFWTMHRGLILGVLDVHTYLVYNPATKEAFSLSRPVSQASLNRGSIQVAIFNLSDCPLSTECNFRVVRFVRAFSKTKGMVFVEVYSSQKREWCVSKFRLKKAVVQEEWAVIHGVFVNNTFFFLTNKRHAVRVQFHSSGQVSSVYSLRLPQRITKGYCESSLDGSQGCLYLSYHNFPNLWIWKHSGSSTHSDSWIPQLIFKESGISLCQPAIELFLHQSVADFSDIHPMFIHPEAPVVFIFAHQSIFAIHLLNDTVEKIVEMNEGEVPLVGTVNMYSPCFASLKCLKPANQDHCK